MRLSFCYRREQQDGCSRDRPAVRLSAQGTHRAGLAALPRLGGGDRGAVGVGAVAAGALREEPPPAARGGRPGPVRGVLRRPGAGPAGAGHHVDAGAAADAQHHGAHGRARRAGVHRRVLRRPGPPLHDPGLQRPARRLALPPLRHPGLPARGRDVGGRGPDPPLPDQGAGRAAAHLPAVLRPLHPDGPGRQPDPHHRQAQVRPGPGRPAGRHDRLPAGDARGPGRGGLRRGRGQPALAAAGGVRRRPARRRQHPRHPAGQQGADGAAPALARRRGAGRDGAARRPGPRSAA